MKHLYRTSAFVWVELKINQGVLREFHKHVAVMSDIVWRNWTSPPLVPASRQTTFVAYFPIVSHSIQHIGDTLEYRSATIDPHWSSLFEFKIFFFHTHHFRHIQPDLLSQQVFFSPTAWFQLNCTKRVLSLFKQGVVARRPRETITGDSVDSPFC